MQNQIIKTQLTKPKTNKHSPPKKQKNIIINKTNNNNCNKHKSNYIETQYQHT